MTPEEKNQLLAILGDCIELMTSEMYSINADLEQDMIKDGLISSTDEERLAALCEAQGIIKGGVKK